MNRRHFTRLLGIASTAGVLSGCYRGGLRELPYETPPFGNVRLLHFTDSHAQLLPIYFREPNVNIGIGASAGRPPHLVGQNLLNYLQIDAGSTDAHAFTYLDFVAAAERFGKVGGFAHLKTLIDQQRDEVGDRNSLLLDGGDTWHGSATALWSRGRDMIDACNLLGVDVMTGHWEFTYRDAEVMENTNRFKGEFIAQNVRVTEDALFEGAHAYDEDTGHAFKPYTIRFVGGRRVAIIGQAFPYTPIANPARFIPYWSFGIREDELQRLVNEVRAREKPDAVIMLSHNGMDVDMKLASRVTGIDAVLGGHTHDGVPIPLVVDNAGGKTLVTNAGSNGKFLAVLDLDLGDRKVKDFRYRLLPVFSNFLPANAEMRTYIDGVRGPFLDKLEEPLATAESLLYRRGNFNGPFDQVICDALMEVGDAEIALSPGFRWGTSVLPGDTITMERVMDQTAITYPETYVETMSGAAIKTILENVADNLFHRDPYYQQGGDMIRVGGMNYTCDPIANMNHRISNVTTSDGRILDASKQYKVSGWATVGAPSSGPPVWDVVAEYLRDHKKIKVSKLNTPKLTNVENSPGLADYSAV